MEEGHKEPACASWWGVSGNEAPFKGHENVGAASRCGDRQREPGMELTLH